MTKQQAWAKIKTWIDVYRKDTEEAAISTVLSDLNERVEALERIGQYRPEYCHTNQGLVAAWIKQALGEESAVNGPERSLRLVEEAIELTQALGVSADEVHRLVDYVFSRPAGDVAREIAGCQVTLYGVASAVGVDADAAFAEELVRIHQLEVIERVQRRQKEKREVTGGGK